MITVQINAGGAPVVVRMPDPVTGHESEDEALAMLDQLVRAYQEVLRWRHHGDLEREKLAKYEIARLLKAFASMGLLVEIPL